MRALRHRTCRLTGATIRMSSGCIDLGAGVKFGNESKVGFTVEARYIYGLKDLKLNTVSSSDSYKTRSFLILGGIIF